TWSAHTSGTTNVLYSVYFTDANTGWAAGEVGTILKTTNGGSTWSAQTSGTTDILRSLYFTDANTGWAVGGDGTILKTTNGGNTWAAQTSGTTSFLLSAYFTDANTGWAVGDFGTILKTTNGGSTWSAQTSRTIEDLYSVYFTDVNTGWAVGGFGTILKTTNGGSTWSAQTSGTTSFLLSVYFTDANTGWVVGELGTILKTTRGETAILNVDVQELSISAKPEQTGSAPFKISNIGTAPLSFNIGASSQFVSVSSGNAIPELSSFKSADETAPLPGNHAQAKPQAVKAANMQMAKSPAPAALGNDVLVLDDGDSTSSFFLGFNNGASFYWSNVFNLAGAGFMLEQIRFYMRTQSASANPVYIGVLNAAGEALVEGTLQMKLSTIGEWYAVNLTSPLSFNAGESFRLVIGADGAISHPAGVDTSGQVRDNSFYSGQPKNGFVNLNTVPGFENGAFLIRAAGTKTGGGNQPPVARAIASASQAKVNEPITFDASQSFDPDGQITEYLWNFGDNTTSNQKVATHAYAQAGNYLVQLTVTDDMGATGQAVRFLTIIPGGANRLAVNPTSGTIAPGGAQTINVTFNAQGLTEGNYQGQIDIASNGGNRTIPVRIRVSNTTGVDDNVAGVPAAFRLEQNYPNPFNPETSIRYELPNNGNVTLAVFELNGRRVALLESGLKTAGQHLIRWDGRDQAGIRVPSGIYFYRLEATTAKGAVTTLTKKLTVLK
ncbi:MAG: YCF48-related protein, partial [bacterium]